jgi:hypothetical protein
MLKETTVLRRNKVNTLKAEIISYFLSFGLANLNC